MHQNGHKKNLLSKATDFVHSQSESVPEDFVFAQRTNASPGLTR